MDIFRFRQFVFVDLYDGPDHYKLPFRSKSCHFPQQRRVKTFIDNPAETELRPVYRGLIFRLGKSGAPLPEMFDIYTRRERENLRMAIFFCFVKAVTSGKD